MDKRELYLYLLAVRRAAIDAECARDQLQMAEHRLTRISTAKLDTITHGTIDTDLTAMRIAACQSVRQFAAQRLHSAVDVLRQFKNDLESSPLGEDEQRLLWTKYVMGKRGAELARKSGYSLHHTWLVQKECERVLSEYLGDGENP